MSISTIPYTPESTVYSIVYKTTAIYTHDGTVSTDATDWTEVLSIPSIEMTGISKFLIRIYLKASTIGSGFAYASVKINGEFVVMFPAMLHFQQDVYPIGYTLGTSFGIVAMSDESTYVKEDDETYFYKFMGVLDVSGISGIQNISIVAKKEGGGSAEVQLVKLYEPVEE